MHAKHLHDLVDQLKLEELEPRFATIYGGITGYYMAPFMGTNKLGCLKEKYIPAEHRDTHRKLKTLRNKIFMHLDKDIDTVKVEDKSWTPSTDTLEQIQQLLNWCINDLTTKIDAYMKSRIPRMILVPGNYILKPEGTEFDLEPEQ